MAAMEAADPAATAAVFRLVKAYQASQAAYLAADLGLADRLAAGPRTAEDLAADTGTHAPSLRRLLRALASFGLFREEDDGSFALAPLGTALRSDVEGSALPWVRMFGHPTYWQSWGALGRAIQTGETGVRHALGASDSFDHHKGDAAFAKIFNDAMTAFSAGNLAAVLSHYDFSRAKRIVDVGGGHGGLLAGILNANPGPKGTVYDIPHVVAGAPALLAEKGVADRCTAEAGDMFERVPEGADLYLLSRIIHDWNDEKSTLVLKNCRRAMAPGGKVVLVEMVLPEKIGTTIRDQDERMNDLNMLVRDGGQERAAAEFGALFAGAGLRLERVVQTTLANTAIIEAVPA
ncbi:MAG TPA: methyltransferase [Hyphomicrobiales bacterium]|nr:methyltransferase [Hyphomicrobiales bacterium]